MQDTDLHSATFSIINSTNLYYEHPPSRDISTSPSSTVDQKAIKEDEANLQNLNPASANELQCKGNGQLRCQRTNLTEYIIDHKNLKSKIHHCFHQVVRRTTTLLSSGPLLMAQSTKDLKTLKQQFNLQINRTSNLDLMGFQEVKNRVPLDCGTCLENQGV